MPMSRLPFMTGLVPVLMLLAVLAVPLPAVAADDGGSLLEMYVKGPIQRIGDSFINPMKDPPTLPINLELVMRLAKTGDIIIENNQAFPQWHVVFGSLNPNLQYVHAGMVLTGADFLTGLVKIALLYQFQDFLRSAGP